MKRRTRPSFRRALLVAFVLHLPFAPTRASRLFDAIFHTGSLVDYDDPDAQAIIPIDLELEDRELVSDDKRASESAANTAAGDQSTTPAGSAGPSIDAGVITDAGASDASIADAGSDAGRRPRRDGGADDAGALPLASDAGSDAAPAEKPVEDPTVAAGSAGKIAAKDPNVQVYIAGECIKKHDLGPWFGKILRTIPEWNSFFANTPIDPISDLSHLLITGPQFRESSKIVAVMDYKLTEAKMKDIIDAVVKRNNGAWLDDSPIPAAKAHVEGGERIFALVPNKKLLVVLPPSAKDQLQTLKNQKGFAKSCSAGIVIAIRTPSRPFTNLFELPQSLSWMRVVVIPTTDGGADVRVEATDSDVNHAADHAKDIGDRFNKIRKIELGITTLEVMDQTDFSATGGTINAKTHVSKAQLKLIMGVVEARLAARLAEREAGAPVEAPKL